MGAPSSMSAMLGGLRNEFKAINQEMKQGNLQLNLAMLGCFYSPMWVCVCTGLIYSMLLVLMHTRLTDMAKSS